MAFSHSVNFGFNFQQLRISRSLRVDHEEGSPGEQEYDAIGGGYWPDYTFVPLIIQPDITVNDPDEVLAPVDVDVRINKDLANMAWTVREEGQPDLRVTNASPDYQVETSGDNLGRLTVMRNVRPNRPLTLVFTAEYQDPRNGEILQISMRYTLFCRATVQQSVLRLDTPAYHLFNPLEGTKKTVRASIFSGDRQVPSRHCRCRWQVRDNDSWANVGSRVDLCFAKVSADTLSLEIAMDSMASDETFRCIGFVGADPTEAHSKMVLGESFDQQTFRIRRQLPGLNVRIEDMPTKIPKSQTEVFPRAQFDFDNYLCQDPSSEVVTRWKTARGTASTTPTYAEVAEGIRPTIKADKVNATYGQQLKVEVEDRGQYCILTDGRGIPITDGEGKVILVR